MNFSSPSYGVTICEIKQEGVPEVDKFGNLDVDKKVLDGWKTKHFDLISKLLGYAKVQDEDDD